MIALQRAFILIAARGGHSIATGTVFHAKGSVVDSAS